MAVNAVTYYAVQCDEPDCDVDTAALGGDFSACTCGYGGFHEELNYRCEKALAEGTVPPIYEEVPEPPAPPGSVAPDWQQVLAEARKRIAEPPQYPALFVHPRLEERAKEMFPWVNVVANQHIPKDKVYVAQKDPLEDFRPSM